MPTVKTSIKTRHVLQADIVMEHNFGGEIRLSEIQVRDIPCWWDHKLCSREAAELFAIHAYIGLYYSERAYYIKSYTGSAAIQQIQMRTQND